MLHPSNCQTKHVKLLPRKTFPLNFVEWIAPYREKVWKRKDEEQSVVESFMFVVDAL